MCFVETQVNHDGTVELSYKPDSAIGRMIITQFAVTMPQLIDFAQNLDLVSFDADEFCFVYDHAPSEELLAQYHIGKKTKDYYCAKVSKNCIEYKFYYQRDIDIISQLNLPKNQVCYAEEYGIGYTPLTHRYDYYFYVKPSFDFFKHFSYQYPDSRKYNESVYHYGVSIVDGKVVKVKRYYYQGLDYGKDHNLIAKGLV